MCKKTEGGKKRRKTILTQRERNYRRSRRCHGVRYESISPLIDTYDFEVGYLVAFRRFRTNNEIAQCDLTIGMRGRKEILYIFTEMGGNGKKLNRDM